MKSVVAFGLLPVLLAFGGLQKAAPRPKFTNYPVKEIYKGKPAAPILSKSQRRYRTMIREGAKSKVDFAGHYTVPLFGCGAGCSGFYLVDSVTGKVYDGFTVADLPFSYFEKPGNENTMRIEYHACSRLLQVNGCPNETNCGFYDYVMVDGVGLKLLRKKPLAAEFQ
jgi:hypothetical protein